MLGRRPAGRLDRRQPLLATVRRVRERLGLPDELVAASTDANAALAAGIPALCLGCAQGGEMHTPGEYIEIASLAAGREQLRSVLARRCSGTIPAHDRSRRTRSIPWAPTSSSAPSPACAARASSPRAFASSASSCASRTRQQLAAWRDGGPRTAARGGARRARRRRDARGRRGAGRRLARRPWSTCPGVQAAITGDEYAESEIAVKADAGFRARARAARHPRRRARDGRHLVGRPLRGAGPPRRPRAVVAAQRSHGRQRLRAPDRRPDRARRPQHHAGRAHRRPRRAARARGARRLPRRRRAPLPRRSAADRGHAARGRELHARRLRAHAGGRGARASASTRASR